MSAVLWASETWWMFVVSGCDSDGEGGIWMVSLMPSMITIIINIRVGPTSDRKWDIMTETRGVSLGQVSHARMTGWRILENWESILTFWTLPSFIELKVKTVFSDSLLIRRFGLGPVIIMRWEMKSYPLYNRQQLRSGARLAAVRKPGLDGVKDQ